MPDSEIPDSELQKRFQDAGLRVTDIAPIEINHHRWLCIGFEEEDRSRGDFMHLALVQTSDLSIKDGTDLYEAALSACRGNTGVYVRIHSECLLGDALCSTLCDCRDQLNGSLSFMETGGILVYLRQEGRGIGMRSKLSALALQHGVVGGKKVAAPLSPDEANLALGFKVDERDYTMAGGVLRALDVGSVRLITGNPTKLDQIKAMGVAVDEIVDVWSSSVSMASRRELRQKIARGYNYARRGNGLNG